MSSYKWCNISAPYIFHSQTYKIFGLFLLQNAQLTSLCFSYTVLRWRQIWSILLQNILLSEVVSVLIQAPGCWIWLASCYLIQVLYLWHKGHWCTDYVHCLMCHVELLHALLRKGMKINCGIFTFISFSKKGVIQLLMKICRNVYQK